MRRATQLALLLLLTALLVGAALPVNASAMPSQPPPCSPATYDGQLPAYVDEGSTPATAVWMDPAVAPGDSLADPASTLRYVGPAEFAAISGDTVAFHLPVVVDGATLAFVRRGGLHDHPLLSGIPETVSGPVWEAPRCLRRRALPPASEPGDRVALDGGL